MPDARQQMICRFDYQRRCEALLYSSLLLWCHIFHAIDIELRFTRHVILRRWRWRARCFRAAYASRWYAMRDMPLHCLLIIFFILYLCAASSAIAATSAKDGKDDTPVLSPRCQQRDYAMPRARHSGDRQMRYYTDEALRWWCVRCWYARYIDTLRQIRDMLFTISALLVLPPRWAIYGQIFMARRP